MSSNHEFTQEGSNQQLIQEIETSFASQTKQPKTPIPREKGARIFFTDFFDVLPKTLSDYGAFNVACIVDLPLFIDPFLLFTSKKDAYQILHAEIIRYLQFLRDKSLEAGISDGLLKAWYCFPEVKQNCLGFCINGSNGRGLGMKFAKALNENLNKLFSDFGNEKVTKGSHLEKLVLIREKVGKDNISDFTTNLIKGYLLEYTQEFAKKHILQDKRKEVNVPRIKFNYDLCVWEDGVFDLPYLNSDFVLLTPKDLLTKDDTWINKEDLRRDFPTIREAISNDALRGQIDHYFRSVLPPSPTAKDETFAMEKTLRKFPALIDHFIRSKEDRGDEAVQRSADKVREVDSRLVQNVRDLVQLVVQHGPFYLTQETTQEETRKKIEYLKQVIENQDGYRIFYVKGKAVEREKDLQILFKLVWEGSPSSVDTEVNNGRGPVDCKVSRGAKESTLVEFKLASNSQLARNLENQVEIYEKANNTTKSFKVILFFTESEEIIVKSILKRLKEPKAAGIILIDARQDNKPSASRA